MVLHIRGALCLGAPFGSPQHVDLGEQLKPLQAPKDSEEGPAQLLRQTADGAAHAQGGAAVGPKDSTIGADPDQRCAHSVLMQQPEQTQQRKEQESLQAARATLLGQFALQVGTECHEFPGAQRLHSLLAYLLLHRDEPQRRTRLRYRLWPDATERRAAGNLRQLLHRLRQQWPTWETCLVIQRHHLQWSPAIATSVDLLEFERLQQSDRPELLAQAATLYQGELLPHCDEEWLQPLRERASEQYAAVLRQLLVAHQEAQDEHSTVATAQRLLRHNPFDEQAHMALLQHYAAAGDRVTAIQLYEQHEQLMERELQLQPAEPLQALVAQLRSSRPDGSAAPLASAPDKETPHSAGPGHATTPSALHSEEELEQLPADAGWILVILWVLGQGADLDLLCAIGRQLMSILQSQDDIPTWPSGAPAASQIALVTRLPQLLQQGWLKEQSAALYQLASPQIEQRLATMVPGLLRRHTHHSIAQALEHDPSHQAHSAATLAYHWRCANEPHQAQRHALQAAQEAKARNDWKAAYAHYTACYEDAAETATAQQALRELVRQILLPRGRTSEARRRLQEAMARAERRDRPKDAAWAELLWGHFLHRQGQLDQAQETFLSALQQVEDGPAAAQLDALHALASLFSQQGDYEQARHYFQRMEALAMAEDAPEQRGDALQGLATLLVEQGDYERAKPLFERALQWYQKTQAQHSEARALNNLTVLLIQQGEYDQGTALVQRTLALRRQKGDRPGEALALTNMAFLQSSQGLYEQAKGTYEAALSMWRELQHIRGQAYALNNLGTVHRDLGAFRDAANALAQSLALAVQIEDRRLQAFHHLHLATLCRYQGELAQANAAIAQAQALFAQLNATQEQTMCWCEIGFLALAQGAPCPADALDAIETLCQSHPLSPRSLAEQTVARLRRAIEASHHERPLLHGQCPDDLPPALRSH